MIKKRCIFHIPFCIEKDRHSGSHIRPLKMLQAFKEIGYEVDIVMGYGKDRKGQIKKIKEQIQKGTCYDFLYSESSTMPTLLTEKHHLPTFPFLDFNFFSYCKQNNIPVGLFYRDIYWRFSQYKNEVPYFKRKFSEVFYEYDLKKYLNTLNILYLPSIKMYPFLEQKYDFEIKSLPPGTESTGKCKLHPDTEDYNKTTSINIFYVGGLNKDIYNLEDILKAVNKVEDVYFVLCTRQQEWEANKKEYEKYMNARIKVVHESGEGLLPYYKNADILNLYIKPTQYRDFAMPVKLFEYLRHVKPILSVKNTAAGDFVEKNDIGWDINYGEKEIEDFLNHIKNNKNEISQKKTNIKKILGDHTWMARAEQAKNDLLSIEK